MSSHVFEVTAKDFERAVVKESASVPILLDFWAEWCGPCRTLSPVLAKLAEEYGGAFRLGTVNSEVEQELAYAFQVQSIPFCVLLVGGRPVDAFAGALPESEVRSFLSRAGVEPAAAKEAEPVDPDSPERRFEDARRAVTRGELAIARERLGDIPDEHENHGRAARILDGLEFLEAELGADHPAEAGLQAARERFAAADYSAAIESLLESVTADKGYRNELARRAIVMCFELMDGTEVEDEVAAFRRRLATLLF